MFWARETEKGAVDIEGDFLFKWTVVMPLNMVLEKNVTNKMDR